MTEHTDERKILVGNGEKRKALGKKGMYASVLQGLSVINIKASDKFATIATTQVTANEHEPAFSSPTTRPQFGLGTNFGQRRQSKGTFLCLFFSVSPRASGFKIVVCAFVNVTDTQHFFYASIFRKHQQKTNLVLTVEGV